MNKWIFAVLTITLSLSVCLVVPQKLQAQGNNFSGVIPFGTTSGRVGFFDQNSGRVYIYDDNLKNCVFNGTVSQLGSPITSAANVFSPAEPVANTGY